jgi:hypothetical protein
MKNKKGKPNNIDQSNKLTPKVAAAQITKTSKAISFISISMLS